MRKYWFEVVNCQNIFSATSDVFLVSCVKTGNDINKLYNGPTRILRKKVSDGRDVVANVLTICVVELDAVPLVNG